MLENLNVIIDIERRTQRIDELRQEIRDRLEAINRESAELSDMLELWERE